jgi:hypothetical protein
MKFVFKELVKERIRWRIADGPWDFDLHNFRQILQIFVVARNR